MRRPRPTAILILGGLALLTFGAYRLETGPVRFDRQRWIESEKEIDDLRNWRSRMAEDVVRDVVRPGMKLDDVVAQLGGMKSDRFEGQVTLHYYTLRYWNPRGLRNLLDNDYDIVTIEFDQHDWVRRAYQEYVRG